MTDEPRPPQEPWLEPGRSAAVDALTQRYREASDVDPRRPAGHVRNVVRAHAEVLLTAGPGVAAASAARPAPAANAWRWKRSLLASLALAGLSALLVLQFDREPADGKARVLDQTAAQSALAPVQEKQGATPPSPAPPAVPIRPAVEAKPSAASAVPTEKMPEEPRTAMPMPAPEAVANEALAQARAAPSQQKSAIAEQADPEIPAAPAPQGVSAMPVRPSALARLPAATDMSRADEGDSNRHRRSGLVSTLPLASALQEAARTGRASQLNRLLAHGAPLDATDAAGRTPLMLATIHNHAAVAQALLAAGADVSLVDHNGMTALQHARLLRRERITELIEEAS